MEELVFNLDIISSNPSSFSEIANKIISRQNYIMLDFIKLKLTEFSEGREDANFPSQLAIFLKIFHRFGMYGTYCRVVILCYFLKFYTLEQAIAVIERDGTKENCIACFPNCFKYDTPGTLTNLVFLSRLIKDSELYLFEKYPVVVISLEIIAEVMRRRRGPTETTLGFIKRFLENIKTLTIDEAKYLDPRNFISVSNEIIKRYPPKLYDPNTKSYTVITEKEQIKPGCYLLPEVESTQILRDYLETFISKKLDMYLRVTEHRFIPIKSNLATDFYSDRAMQIRKEIEELKINVNVENTNELKELILSELNYTEQYDIVIMLHTFMSITFDLAWYITE